MAEVSREAEKREKGYALLWLGVFVAVLGYALLAWGLRG